jgi:predicted nuclease of predicted toxin-antitoxin system
MPKKFYKFKLLLDENMPPRQRFPRINSRYDLKHITQDFHRTGLLDPQVYDFARKEKRLILTFNGEDFRPLVEKSDDTGIIYLSDNLLNEHIDAKLTALLSKSTPNSFFGKFTTLTGETEV